MRIFPKGVVALLVLGLALGLGLRALRAGRAGCSPLEASERLSRAALLVGLAFLAGSPTVHPWYALWVIPFLPGSASPLRAGALLLSLCLPLAYEVQARYTGLAGSWSEATWVRGLVWGPAGALLGWGLFRACACLRAASPARLAASSQELPWLRSHSPA